MPYFSRALRARVLVSAAAFVGLLASARPSRAELVVTSTHARTTNVGASPWLVAGALTPTGGMDDAALETTARAALAAHVPTTRALHLRLETIVSRDDGARVVVFAQEAAGLRVLERGARVLVDPHGVAVVAAAIVEERPFALLSPPISPAVAALEARRHTPFAVDPARAELVVLPTAEGPRRAWLLRATPPFEVPTRPLFVVDAENGRLLARVELVRALDQVHAFAQNPKLTPTLDTFTLDRLASGATTLTTAQLVDVGCVDRRSVRTVPGLLTSGTVSLHACDLVATATADASFDFLYPRPSSDADEADALSETSLAYHADRALAFFADRGLSSLRKEASPLTVVANVRMPSGWSGASVADLACSTCALERLDNAYFVPSPDPFEDVFPHHGDALFLGQGTALDFAYDGDVVAHEATHALVASTAELVSFLHADEQGASDAPTAMNEALADYFSSALAGDPAVGEYVGGGGGIRRLDNADRCPDVLFGEPHADSTAFSGALWTARGKADDARAFDRGVLLGMQLAPSGDLDFADLAALLEEGVKDAAGDSAAKALGDAMTSRGLAPCTRVRELSTGGGTSKSFGFLSVGAGLAAGNGPDGVTPGVVQFHQALPFGAVRVTVRMSLREFPEGPAWLGPAAWTPELLVKFGDAAPMRFTAGKGDFTARVAAAPAVSLVVPSGSTHLHLMIAASAGQGLYDDLSVDVTRVDPSSDAGPDASDDVGADAPSDAGARPDGPLDATSAGDAADAADAADDRASESPALSDPGGESGCGCRLAGPSADELATPRLATPAALAAASAIASIVNRRRRRDRVSSASHTRRPRKTP